MNASKIFRAAAPVALCAVLPALALSARAVSLDRYAYPAAAVVAPVKFSQPLPGPAHDAAEQVHADKVVVEVADREFVESAKPGDVRMYWKRDREAGWIGGVVRIPGQAPEGCATCTFDLSLAMNRGRARLGDVLDCWIEFRGARYGVSPKFRLVCGGPDELSDCPQCWTVSADGFEPGAAAAAAAGRDRETPRAPAAEKPRAPSFLDASFSSLDSVSANPEFAPLAEIARGLVAELEGKKRETAAKKETLDRQLKAALGRAKDAAAAKGDLETVIEFEAAIASPDDAKWTAPGANPALAGLFSKRRAALEKQSEEAVRDALRILGTCWRKLEDMKVAETRKGNVALAKEVLRYQGDVKAAGEALQGGKSSTAQASAGKGAAGAAKSWRVTMDCKLSATVASDHGYRKTSAKSFDISIKNFDEADFEGELVWHFVGKGRNEKDSKILETRREKVKIAAGKGFEKTVTSGTYSGYSYSYSSYSYSDSSAKLVQGAVVQLLKDGRVVQSYASMAAWAEAAKKNPFSL